MESVITCPICRTKKQSIIHIFQSGVIDDDDQVKEDSVPDSVPDVQQKIYYHVPIFGSEKLYYALVPFTGNEDLSADLFRKYSSFFSTMTVFTQGPMAYVTFHQTGEIKAFPKNLSQQLEEDCENERKNGTFKDDYPNSSIQFSNSSLKITPITDSEIEEYNKQYNKDNKKKRSIPEFTVDINAEIVYEIRYMHDGSVSYLNNL